MKKQVLRHAEQTISRLAKEYPAVLVTGARQTGKTTLLKKITDARNIPYTTFDDPMEEASAKNDAKSFIEFHPAPRVFDEVQYVPHLFRYLKMQIDSDRKNGMYFLTGSQQFNLMEATAESLSGRIAVLQLYPLSERELRGKSFDAPFIPTKQYLLARNKEIASLAVPQKKLWTSIQRGFYPEVAAANNAPRDFYANYLKTYIERDIRKLAHVASEMQFLQFISIAAARTAQLLNYADIARECSVSEVTVKKWISLLLSSGVIYLLPPYSANVEKRVVKTPKLYFMDTGLAAYLTRWTTPEVLCSGASAGAFFETYVVAEIVKSFANKGITPPLFFYRDKDKTEIDLLIEQDGILYPVEIKKTATPTGDDAKNFHILSKIKNVQIADAVVICSTNNVVSLSHNGVNAAAIPAQFV